MNPCGLTQAYHLPKRRATVKPAKIDSQIKISGRPTRRAGVGSDKNSREEGEFAKLESLSRRWYDADS